MPNGTPHPTAAIVPPGPEAGLIYTPYEYPYTLAPATSILEYPIEPSGVLGKYKPSARWLMHSFGVLDLEMMFINFSKAILTFD